MKEFEDDHIPLTELISSVFSGATIGEISDVGQGRGIFSRVVKVFLDGAPVSSVVVKAPALGVNGEAGRSSGAYYREALAYRELLDQVSVRTPLCYEVREIDGDPWFVLEDLSSMQTIDQLDGLSLPEAERLGDVLAQLHRTVVEPTLASMFRGPGPERFDLETLEVGLGLLNSKWQVDEVVSEAFEKLLVNRGRLVEEFVQAGQQILCHGDPRADNVMLSTDETVLLDWQQISMSFGEADLAWLLATSCTVDDRPAIEGSLLSRYAAATNSNIEQVQRRYRLGLARPGLAVLMLSTRDASDDRAKLIVSESLHRIGHALADHLG